MKLFKLKIIILLLLAVSVKAAGSTLYGLGNAFSEWDSNNAVNIPESNESGIFIIEKELIFYNDNKQFKFALSQGDWQNVQFLVPATADYNGNVKTIADGGEYGMLLCSESAENLKDYYWGTPFNESGNYRITIDINAQRLSITKVSNSYKAPLCWSIYEYCREEELAGVTNIDMSESDWDQNIEWVSDNLKQYGYDMICTDGFMSMLATDESGYMTKYGSMYLTDLVNKCKLKGLKLGVYDNPLWIHGSLNTPIESTSLTFGDLTYDATKDADDVLYPDNTGDLFTWVVPSHNGAEEYIDGFFKHYKDMGVDFIRMDFLCLFESGFFSEAEEPVGKAYGRENYELAMKYIGESAKKYGILVSMVMPDLYNNAELEKKYGNMIRIVADVFDGGWDHLSDRWRGTIVDGWPNCHNQFDGFVHWSNITGRGKVIPDGDFTRLNTFSSDEEKKFSVSLQLMAGGPVAVADRYNTIQTGDLSFYQNTELLALNEDGFVGKPLSDNLSDSRSQIWYGQMSNGDWIVGLFNRETTTQIRNINFRSDLGIAGTVSIRDLWEHTDLGTADSFSESITAHGCKIYRLKISSQDNIYIGGTFNGWNLTQFPMAKSEENNWSATTYFSAGNYEMKFTNTTNWTGDDWGGATGLTGITGLTTGGGANISFNIPDSGYYRIDFNDATLAYSIKKNMYVGGSFNNFVLADLPMIQSDTYSWYTNPVYLTSGDYSIKFTNTTDWSGDDWGGTTGLSGTANLTTGVDNFLTFNISQSCYYVFKFNDSTLDYSITTQEMYVGGSFNNWDLSQYPMSLSGSHDWHTETPVYLATGEHGIKFSDTTDWSGDDWGNAYGFSGTARLTTGGLPNIEFTTSRPGYYTFNFNDSTLNYSIATQEMYIAGTSNDWDLPGLPMTQSVDKNNWYSTPVYLTAGDYSMKFTNTLDGSGNNWGNSTGLTGTAGLIPENGLSISFTISQSGYYIFKFNDSTLKYSIEGKKMYAAGTFNDWNLSGHPMIQADNFNWHTTPVYMTAGDYSMKFANSTDWSSDDWGNATGLTGTVALTTGGGTALSFTIPQSGYYVFKFNDSTLEYSITAKKLYIGGTFNNWNLSDLQMLESDAYNWYTTPVYITAGDYAMKFTNTLDWSGDDWGGVNGLSGTATLTTGENSFLTFNIPQSTYYVFKFNDSTLVYSIEADKKMYIAGTFNSWDLASLPMTASGSYNWYSAPVYLTTGDYSMKFANTSDWSGDDWGGVTGLTGTATLTTGGGTFLTFTVVQSGYYVFNFNDLNLDYSIEAKKMYVGGTFNNWNLASLPMTASDAYNWYTNSVFLTSDDYEMKFASTTDWSGDDWGGVTGLTGTATLTTGGGTNISFSISQSGYYNFKFNDLSLKYSIDFSTTNNNNEKSNRSLNVYFSKQSKKIVIEKNNYENNEVQIINLKGQKLYIQKFSDTKFLIDTSNWTNKIVIVQIKNPIETRFFKIAIL
ncbi:MAG: hypothetical protein PHH37_00880 [Paludibacter sp.]|nr:hypothetical protein [Paludibacter sp.]